MDLELRLPLQPLAAEVEQEVEIGQDKEQQVDMGVFGDVGLTFKESEP